MTKHGTTVLPLLLLLPAACGGGGGEGRSGGGGAHDEPAAGVSCSDHTDEQVRAAVTGGVAVPPELYSDPLPAKSVSGWLDGCVDDLDHLEQRMPERFSTGVATGGSADGETYLQISLYIRPLQPGDDPDMATVVRLRGTKCSYFDGERLGGAPLDDPGPAESFAAYSWFVRHYLPGAGQAVLGVASEDGGRDDGRSIRLCSVEAPDVQFPECEGCGPTGADVGRDFDLDLATLYEDIWVIGLATGEVSEVAVREPVRQTGVRLSELPP